MALLAAPLRTRALTALFFAAVMGGGLFISAWSFLFLFLAILTISWIEFQRLVDRIVHQASHSYLLLGWILNGWALCLFFSGSEFSMGGYLLRNVLVLPCMLAGFILLILGTLMGRILSMRQWLLVASGNFYLTVPLIVALHLYGYGPLPDAADLPFSPAVWWIVVVIATMWINDTMAYLMGSWIGRTPFSKISPKKTWEGTISGIVCATFFIGWVLDCFLVDKVFHPMAGYLLAFLLAIAGTLGDLFESKLKRLAGVKDSGQLMPGHGGVLDRFDSLFFAIPVLYLFLRLFSLMH